MRYPFWTSSLVMSFALAVRPALAGCPESAPAALAPDPLEAERLFREAKRLQKDGRLSEACPLLEKSYALDPAAGTILQLAFCLELEGKLASSYAHYEEALALAERDEAAERDAGRDEAAERAAGRARDAREHRVALAPRLHKLEVRVSSGAKAQAGLEVRRDGVCLDPGSWNRAMPVDPGAHRITATAVGTKPWQVRVEVVQEGATASVEVPALDLQFVVPLAALGVREAEAARPAADSWIPGTVVTSLGVLGLGFGAVTGVMTLVKTAALMEHCQGHSCPPSAEPQVTAARAWGMASTVSLVTGATVAGVGVTLLVVRPFGRRKMAVNAMAGPGSIWMAGRF